MPIITITINTDTQQVVDKIITEQMRFAAWMAQYQFVRKNNLDIYGNLNGKHLKTLALSRMNAPLQKEIDECAYAAILEAAPPYTNTLDELTAETERLGLYDDQ